MPLNDGYEWHEEDFKEYFSEKEANHWSSKLVKIMHLIELGPV